MRLLRWLVTAFVALPAVSACDTATAVSHVVNQCDTAVRYVFGEDSGQLPGDVAAMSLLDGNGETVEPRGRASLVMMPSAPGGVLVVTDDAGWVWHEWWPADEIPEEIVLSAELGRCPDA